MIPLLRPKIPSTNAIDSYFTKSRDLGKFTNFGPCFDLLVDRLNSQVNRYCLPCSDGTSAIYLAIKAVVKKPKRNIGFPEFTHAGTLNAITMAGHAPTMVSCDPKTGTVDLKSLSKTLQDKSLDALIVVSPFGFKVDFNSYDSFGKKHGIKIIYDLAGAWGMQIPTQNPFTFSLHATKNFSCGEGGIVCFNNQPDWESARRFSNFATNPDRTIDTPYSGNFKATEWTCATALAHLDAPEHLRAKIEKKRKLISQYQAALSKFCDPHDFHMGNSAPSLCVIRGVPAKKLEEFGKREGVDMKQYYMPLHQFFVGYKSNISFESYLALPSDVTEKERDQVILTVKRFYTSV